MPKGECVLNKMVSSQGHSLISKMSFKVIDQTKQKVKFVEFVYKLIRHIG